MLARVPYARSRRTRRRLLVLAMALMGGVALVACGARGPGMHQTDRTQFASNGERIYFAATSDSGDIIEYEGGPGGGMMAGSLACVSCHGPDGRGGRVTLMMRTFDAPDITWPALTAAHGDEGDHGADGEMEHPPYATETLARAITQGVDPAGKPLDSLMPRWRLSDRDLADLIAYLQTLGVEATPATPVGDPAP